MSSAKQRKILWRFMLISCCISWLCKSRIHCLPVNSQSNYIQRRLAAQRAAYYIQPALFAVAGSARYKISALHSPQFARRVARSALYPRLFLLNAAIFLAFQPVARYRGA